MLKFEYRHLYIFIGGYTMEQATLHIDMIKLIEHRNRGALFLAPLLIFNQQYMITIHPLTTTELSEVGSGDSKKD